MWYTKIASKTGGRNKTSLEQVSFGWVTEGAGSVWFFSFQSNDSLCPCLGKPIVASAQVPATFLHSPQSFPLAQVRETLLPQYHWAVRERYQKRSPGKYQLDQRENFNQRSSLTRGLTAISRLATCLRDKGGRIDDLKNSKKIQRWALPSSKPYLEQYFYAQFCNYNI